MFRYRYVTVIGVTLEATHPSHPYHPLRYRTGIREVDVSALTAMEAIIGPLRLRLDEQRAAGKRPRLRPN
jgi:hypothetical protein